MQNVYIAAVIGFFLGALLVWLMRTAPSEEQTPPTSPEEQQKAYQAIYPEAYKEAYEKAKQEIGQKMQADYEKLHKAFADYRAKVNAHFIESVAVVDAVAHKQKALFDKLNMAAKELMEEEAWQHNTQARHHEQVVLHYMISEAETNTTVAAVESKVEETAITADNSENTVNTEENVENTALNNIKRHLQNDSKPS